MTDSNTPADDAIVQIRTHDETPTITDSDDVLYHDDSVYIIHGAGEVTRIDVHRTDSGTIHVKGIVRITTDQPRITPADDVISVGRITHIIHGPGRETRVIP